MGLSFTTETVLENNLKWTSIGFSWNTKS